MGDRNRWSKHNEVVPTQAQTIAYFDTEGDLVLQQTQSVRTGNATMLIHRTNVVGFVGKLVEMARTVEDADRTARAPQRGAPTRGQTTSRVDRLQLVPPTDR